MKRWIYGFVKILVVGLGVGYALHPLITGGSFTSLSLRTLWSFHLLAAFFAYALGVALLPLIWWKILNQLEIRIPLNRAYQALLVASIGRYIPGKVFHVVGRISFLPDASAARVAWSVALESIFLLLGSCVLGAGYLWGAPGVVGGVLLVFPGLWVMERLLAPISRRWPGLEQKVGPLLPFHVSALLVLAYTAVMGLIGLATWILTLKVGLTMPYLKASGAFALSFVAGYLAVLAPAGLGIRESGLVWLLRGYPGAAVSLVAWLMRFTALAVDLAMLGVGLLAGSVPNKTPQFDHTKGVNDV